MEHLYPIPEEVFEFGEDKALISINLYDSLSNVITEIKFDIYYCYNNVYIGKENTKSGYNFELDLMNALDLNVYLNKLQFNTFDTVNTKHRKKITILNYKSVFINVNNTKIEIKELIEQCQEKSFFYRFSINLIEENPKIIVQPAKKFDKPDLHLLKKDKSFIDIFYKELLQLIEKDSDYKSNYKEIIKFFTNNIASIEYKLNTSKKYLDKSYKVLGIC